MPRTPEQRKIYDQSPVGKKSNRISNWKQNGIIDEDLHAVYDYILDETHCMVCFKPYKDSQDRCLDHDHDTGEIRYICCNTCNSHFLREGGYIQTKVNKTNTSGHLNITYDKERDKWAFSKIINKERIYKRFDTLAEAVQWKIDNNFLD
jgi:hypothetical protein